MLNKSILTTFRVNNVVNLQHYTKKNHSLLNKTTYCLNYDNSYPFIIIKQI
jgi:hypothetical protein